MSTVRLRILAPALLAVAACTAPGGGAGPTAGTASPAASTSSPGNASPSPATPAPTPAAATGPWLRAWFSQALAPSNVFGIGDTLVITADGIAVFGAPVPAIFPGPAVMPLNGRQITPAGLTKILLRAKTLGLLSGTTDFGAPTMPGAQTAHIAITVDGTTYEFAGDSGATIECIKAPCDPAPGTPQAFGTFWRDISGLDWLGAEVGPEQAFTPPVYSVLVGAPPEPDPNLGANVAVWPLGTPIASFGAAVANGTARCGTVTGSDAEALRAALAKANQLTQWTQTAATSATFGLTVRPLTNGQDACREVFGVG